jgi:4-hydroxybenzoate polyprenyltransferase
MPNAKPFLDNLPHYISLMRMERPIGWLLLLWPTLWALWISSGGKPNAAYLWIFTLGVIVMRSAGCVINDYADREYDPLVDRTNQRPLAAGNLLPQQAIRLFVLLGAIAIGLLLLLPSRVWPWAIPATALTIIYPYTKRFIQAPQMVLGLAFSFSIPMVYVVNEHAFDGVFWWLFTMNFLWVIMYDTAYAMSDRQDDLKIGVKSTAIWFGRFDKIILGALQIIITLMLMVLMIVLNLSNSFMLAVCIVAGLFAYQQWLIRDRERAPCFQAFLNNGWVGGVIWFGLLASL